MIIGISTMMICLIGIIIVGVLGIGASSIGALTVFLALIGGFILGLLLIAAAISLAADNQDLCNVFMNLATGTMAGIITLFASEGGPITLTIISIILATEMAYMLRNSCTKGP